MKRFFYSFPLTIFAFLLIFGFLFLCACQSNHESETNETEPGFSDTIEAENHSERDSERDSEIESESHIETEFENTSPLESESLNESDSESPTETDVETEINAETESDSLPSSFLYDLSEFQIIYENSTLPSVTSHAKALKDALFSVGIEVTTEKDQGEPNIVDKEILLGNTSHPLTANLLSNLPDDRGFAIEFYENKIVLAARNDYFLAEAIDSFADQYLTTLSDSFLTVSSEERWVDGPCATFLLSQNGVSIARVVRDYTAHKKINESAISLVNRLESIAGASFAVFDQYDYNATALDLVLGITEKYEESEMFRASLALNEYGFSVEGSKIVIAGHTIENSVIAVSLFNKFLQYSIYDEATSSLTLTLPLRVTETVTTQFADFPHYPNGIYKGAIECGNNTVQMHYESVDFSTLDIYLNDLMQDGYVILQDNTNDGQTGNRFVTLQKEGGLLHLSYYAYDHSFTVLSDPLNVNSYYEDIYEGSQLLQSNTLSVMTLDYSKHAPVNNCDPRLNAGGLSYIITLRDGRFIVIDGGCNSKNGTQDCDILYEYMLDHTLLTDEAGEKQIIIAAWIFTHDSPDHHEAFESFAPKYCKTDSIVTVQNLIYNNGVETQYSDGYRTGLYLHAPTYVKTYFPGCRIIQPHTGQKFTVGEIEIEFLYTLESLYPTLATDANDASMLFRMTIDGMTVLFTGDAIAAPCDLTAKIYGNYLKSDMMQINHHGTTGLTVSLYNCVDPLYSLWPTSKTCFEARTSGTTYPVGMPSAVSAALNLRIITELNEKHNTDDFSVHSWYADGPIEIMTFLPNKTISIETYILDPSLTPELPPFVPTN